MSDRTTSVEPINATSTTSTGTPDAGTCKPGAIGTAPFDQFGSLMAPVSWWATSTQQEQLGVWEMYHVSGEQDADFVALCQDYASAAELLDDDEECQGEDTDTEQEEQDQEQPAAVQAAEPVPTATLAQANATLQRFGQQCRTATDHNYVLGQLAAQFVDEFLGAAPGKSTRTTAVERLAAEWLLWDEESMAEPQSQAMKRLRAKVNVLLRGNAVANLLGDGRGVAKGDGTKRGKGKGRGRQESAPIAWGKLRELSPLVERDADDYREAWHVLEHVRDQAASLVAEVASSGMAREDVVKAVAKLVEEERTARLAEAKAQGAAAAREAAEKREAEMAARKAAKDAEREAAKLATVAEEQGTEEAKDAAAKALEQLREEQARAKAATDAAEQAARRLARQQEEEREATRKAAEAEAKKATKAAKRERAEGPASVAPPTPVANQGTSLLAAARLGTAKDVAEMAVELVAGSDEPDDVFEHLLHQLDGHKDLSKQTHRAVKAALLVLSRKASPLPADVANRLTAADGGAAAAVNGQLAA
jgi:hypothetical protein